MIAIYYIDEKPFFCEEIQEKGIQALSSPDVNQGILERCLLFEIIGKIKKEKLYIFCGLLPYQGKEKCDIKNSRYTKITKNIKPVWLENDHGKQITFFIQDIPPYIIDEKTELKFDMKMCQNCLKIFPVDYNKPCDICKTNNFDFF